jgi:hypothetical protein
MYGKHVDCNGYKVWINCLPSTTDKELKERAKRKVERYLNGEIDSLR